MEIVLSSINDIEKYNPYVDLNQDIEDEYFEDKFLEYFNDFREQVDKLKEKLNHKDDKKIDGLFDELVKQRNDEEIERLCDNYLYYYIQSDKFVNESRVVRLRKYIRKIKDLILISEPANMKRLHEVDDKIGEIIDEVSEMVFHDTDSIDSLLNSFEPASTLDMKSYCDYMSYFRKKVEDLSNHYRRNYSVKTATKYINELTNRFDKVVHEEASKLGYLYREQKLIDKIVGIYDVKRSNMFHFEWVNELKREIEKLKSRYKKVYSSKMADQLIKLLDSKTSEIIDRNANKAGYPDIHEEKLQIIFSRYRPDKINLFDIQFYSSKEERDRAKEKYQGMTSEEKKVFEMRIYEQYIRYFKAQIREHNKNIRKIYSPKYANKMVDLVNKRADMLIRQKAKEIGKPIPRNPWFIRKYLWADTENFATSRGVAFRKFINPFMSKLVNVAMKNKLVIEERPELDPTKQYVFVPTHYFTEDIIGEYASLGRQAYVLMGTTDQIENNFLMLAAIMMGLFYVDREDLVSRRECVDKQNRIIELGSNVVNYISGSWENSENELQPLSFSGPYRTSVAKDVQIVPVGLYLVREEKKIYVRYGEPLDVNKLDESTANEVIRDTLASIHFKQMSKHSIPIETVQVDGYGKTHNLPYNQHIYYMEQVANEYWNQYWSKPFAKEEIGVRPKKVSDEADVYSFVDNLSRENLIRLSKYLSEPMLRRYERDERYNIVKYIDENYDRLSAKNSGIKVRRRTKRKMREKQFN